MGDFKNYILTVLLSSIFIGGVHAQSISNFRSKKVVVQNDSIVLDTLSIVPGSIRIYSETGMLKSTDFRLYPVEAVVRFNEEKWVGKELSFNYRVFDFNLSQDQFNKDTTLLMPDFSRGENQFRYTTPKTDPDFFGGSQVQKNGSVSRGVRFGNNQDLSVNSALNLQLSGKVSNELGIKASISDENIPIQAEGNTQQLQEFDQVYIQLFTDQTQINAGDFMLRSPKSYFMTYTKKAQGLNVNSKFRADLSENENKTKPVDFQIEASGALSRGKFNRMQFMGVEGNQGPYRLQGAENEPFIIILSGTERVFIDGKQLTRGQDNDYVINYNTAEITFTATQLITKDRRIAVEFQYTDQNYARSLFQFGGEAKTEKLTVRFNAYSEQDAKNQSLQQDLSDAQKEILANAGDDVFSAFSNSVDSIGFSENQVMYKLVDSLGFDSVLVFSTNQDSALYRARFSNVGSGNGNYVFDRFTALGRVYRWVPPVGGVPQGDFEPVISLIAPKKSQMVTLGADYNISKKTTTGVELAYTSSDNNTFSELDAGDNQGVGIKWYLQSKNRINKDSTWFLRSGLNFETTHRDFNRIERFRAVEFERNWNTSDLEFNDHQFISSATLGLENQKAGFMDYTFENFNWGEGFNGFKNNLKTQIDYQGFNAKIDASALSTQGQNQTDFIRHDAFISQRFGNYKLGFNDIHEFNRFVDSTGGLQQRSYQFYDWEVYFAGVDSIKVPFKIFYRHRFDRLPENNGFKQATVAYNAGGEMELNQNPNQQFKLTLNYRTLRILEEDLIDQDPEGSVVGRVEYNSRWLGGMIQFNTFYEVGSGLELQKEFVYLEVPAGQGVYTWVDYNEDGIKDLNEFEIAQYTDQATFIRLFTPTNTYVRVFSNQFNQSLNIKPERKWGKKEGVLKFLSRFSNQTLFRSEQKTNTDDLSISFNPFSQSLSDTALISQNASFRNTFFFNRTNNKIGMDYTYQDNGSKILLANGFDSRMTTFHQVNIRWNITREFTLKTSGEVGRNISSSDYTTGRTFYIKYYETGPEFSYQPNTAFRVSLKNEISYKENQSDDMELARISDSGIELRFNKVNKGSFLAGFNHVYIDYNGNLNSALAFEMLNSLRPGNNFTWNITYQRTLANNLQISINYNGRKPNDIDVIHNAGVEVRAFF